MALPTDVWVDWSPTHQALSATPPTWVKLNYPLKLVAYRRGLKRAAQRVEAGEATIVFDNKSRDLDPTNRQSPLWPNLEPRRPIRIRASVNGRIRTLWSGFTSSIKPQWSLNSATATIACVDRRGVYADSIAPLSGFRTRIAQERPRWWWPLDEKGGSYAYSLGSEPFTATHVNVNGGGQPLVPYEVGGSVQYGDTGNSRSEVGTTTSRVVPSFTFGFVCLLGEAPTQVVVPFSQGQGGSANLPEGDLGFRVGTDGICLFGVTNGTNYSNVKGPSIDTGAPVLVFGRYGVEAGTWKMNLVLNNQQFNATNLIAGIYPRPGGIRMGNSVTTQAPFKGSLSHVTMWDRYLDNATLTAIANEYVYPRVYDDVGKRIGWLLDQAGDASPRVFPEVSRELLGAYRGGLSLLDAADRAAATDGGIFIMDAEGRPTYFSRYHQGRVGGTYSSDPSRTPGVGLQEVDVDMDERGFFTSATAKVATPNETSVDYIHPNAARYGELPWAPDTEYVDPFNAFAGARRSVGDAQPKPHLTNAVAYVQDADMDEALDLDVWDSCTVVAHPPDAAGPGPFAAWGGSAPMWGGVEDTFDRPNHTTDPGPGWIATGGTWGILGNALYKTATDNVHQYLTQELSAADQEMTFTMGNGGGYQGGVLRFSGQLHHVLLQTFVGGGVEMYSTAGAGYVGFGTIALPVAVGSKVRGVVQGNELTVYVDGVKAGPYTLPNLPNGTRAGVVHYSIAARTDAFTARRLDAVGWAGPPPISQDSRVLEVDVTFDFIRRTTTKKLVVEPNPFYYPAVQLLTPAAQNMDAGHGWFAIDGLTVADGAAVPTTTTAPISGAQSLLVTHDGLVAPHAGWQTEGRNGRGLFCEAWFKALDVAADFIVGFWNYNSAGVYIGGQLGAATRGEVGEKVRATCYAEAVRSVAYCRMVIYSPVVGLNGRRFLVDDARWWSSDEATI